MSAADLCDRLWDTVIAGDETAAAAVVFAAVEAGIDPEAVLLDAIAPVQAKVGLEWAANRITVAQEHAATAINDRVIAALAHHPSCVREPTLGRVAVACVDGEWHAMPARLLAEVLRLRGWRVDFLGAQVPVPHLVAHLHQRGPDALALSSSLATRLPAAHATITACRATGVPVIAGGAGFGPDGRYAHLLGADAWAADARSAAERLAAGLDLDADRLPHVPGGEHAAVSRRSPDLVRAVLADLPQVREYTDVQRQRAAEDVARIVEFLAAALYAGDADLFAGHILWSAEVLAARGVPSAVLDPALRSLRGQLADLPPAVRAVDAALVSLGG